jgi:hypothetical protein
MANIGAVSVGQLLSLFLSAVSIYIVQFKQLKKRGFDQGCSELGSLEQTKH